MEMPFRRWDLNQSIGRMDQTIFLIYPDTEYLGKIRYLEGLELSEEELGDEGADKGGGNLLLGMAPVINEKNC